MNRVALFVVLAACTPAGSTRSPQLVCPAGPAPTTEAGFVELPTGDADVQARHFYAFHPADSEPLSKPLFVLFNGGPTVTSFYLMALHTGPTTLEPNLDLDFGAVGANPYSWTRFGNLLYIEARQAGLSYDLDPDGLWQVPSPLAQLAPYDAFDDARAFWRVLLRFWDAHPSLACQPVILGGESYGGTRAQLMLAMLYNSRSDAGDALAVELGAHFASVIPGAASEVPPAALVQQQFAHQILIQPLVSGAQRQGRAQGSVPLRIDPSALEQHFADAMTSIDTFRGVLQLPLEQIAGLTPPSRGAASRYRQSSTDPLQPALGALASFDNYFEVFGIDFRPPIDGLGGRFVDNLRWVDTFITDAAWDTSINTPSLVPALVGEPDIAGATLAGSGAAQVISVGYRDGTQRTITLPRYEASEHMVAAYEPARLFDDITRFLAR